ncbi:ABC transporter ATP-binding protein [Undibacterium sp. Jales W-56]|uniref:ABC transporter ATP-binding protein n=1 Tax=Undibacterium sp. Jales W-56 TaxID=2897325 RepID=UPI0021CE4C52|nr:ABC transporter ATP-binding protein [Undibacterium sp. Jales W-56]MCU6434916.1 ABC transporter ATP-binding protein [Undibacterium sp. Jales W-56]
MSSEFAISVRNVSKCYQIYERPNDRLKQGLFSLAARLCPFGKVRDYLRLRAQNCAKQYWALHDISFELKKGETFGIIGRNGSGKSTLLQILCGTLNQTKGEVIVNGRVAALLELGSGFNPEYTGRENIYMNGQLLGLSKNQVDERIEDIIAFADIGDFIEQPVKTYSSGMFVRVAFAVIAHVDADILVIDEALAVGDAFFTQKCMRFLRKFMKQGSILFVSHDTVAVKSLCERVIWLDKGSMLFDGSAKEASDKYLQNFYEATPYESVAQNTNITALNPSAKLPRKDARLEWLNLSNLRNDIKAFEFDQNVDRYGSKEAQIETINFLDTSGTPLTWIIGGEDIRLKVDAVFHRDIYSPIIGFYVKDRLGQVLFGDNTYLTYHDRPLSVSAGQKVVAEFQFLMPILLKGDYSVCVAIAAGSNQDHIPLDWINEAVILKSESSSVVTGLVGVPMQKIEFNVTSR